MLFFTLILCVPFVMIAVLLPLGWLLNKLVNAMGGPQRLQRTAKIEWEKAHRSHGRRIRSAH